MFVFLALWLLEKVNKLNESVKYFWISGKQSSVKMVSEVNSKDRLMTCHGSADRSIAASFTLQAASSFGLRRKGLVKGLKACLKRAASHFSACTADSARANHRLQNRL